MVTNRLIGLVTLLLSYPALASTTVWDFNEANNPIQNPGPKYPGNYIEWTQNGVTMTLSAWSETINDSSYCSTNPSSPECSNTGSSGTTELDPFIDKASLVYYQGGENLGISNQDEASPGNDPGSPQHSIDNIPNSSSVGYNDYDMVLAEFSELVSLTGIFKGWEYTDSDVSILAYTGSDTITSDPFFSTSSTWSDLLNQGWAHVGDYAGLDSTVAISTPIESQYWLIGAYNDAFGGSFSSAKDDGFKLGSLTTKKSSTPPPPATSVSEPGSTALLTLGLALIWMRIRRQS